MSTLTEIGAYEAKTRLPEYLRKVREGDTFRITQRGEPVADLVPAGTAQKRQA
ncbi:MAG: type II toxin-antitoxin system prevent-host-death family antitoxin, partial [Betaproteobacteria bacterium]|nr:type II toxin-antitoxin system prevent-host-death family antitoxin [Candidatus Proximibacter danicus]